MIRVLFSIISIYSICFAIGCGPKDTPPQAEKGIINLTAWDFERDGPVRLTGEWAFYWKRLLEPREFKGDTTPVPTGFMTVPGFWNDFTANGRSFSGNGYATFHLKIKIKAGPVRLELRRILLRKRRHRTRGQRRGEWQPEPRRLGNVKL